MSTGTAWVAAAAGRRADRAVAALAAAGVAATTDETPDAALLAIDVALAGASALVEGARRRGARVLVLAGAAERERALAALEQWADDVLWDESPDDERASRCRATARRRLDEDGRRARALRLVAHDLNNPLAAIRILGEMLEGDLDDPDSRRDAADILQAADVASGLVEGLAAWLRQLDPRPAHRAPLDLRDVLKRAADRAALRGGVHVVVGEAPAPVEGDFELLVQAVGDVLLNARRLAEEGRPVEAVVEAPATLVVAAAGASVPAALLPRLLDPLGAVELREQRVPVAALGLSAASGAVERHGGRLTLDDLGGAGLRVRVELPPASPGA